MNNNPKMSVIISTYNRVHLIETAIKSALNQTYQDFEIIIIDDGFAARNTGIKVSRGKYIALLDCDVANNQIN